MEEADPKIIEVGFFIFLPPPLYIRTVGQWQPNPFLARKN